MKEKGCTDTSTFLAVYLRNAIFCWQTRFVRWPCIISWLRYWRLHEMMHKFMKNKERKKERWKFHDVSPRAQINYYVDHSKENLEAVRESHRSQEDDSRTQKFHSLSPNGTPHPLGWSRLAKRAQCGAQMYVRTRLYLSGRKCILQFNNQFNHIHWVLGYPMVLQSPKGHAGEYGLWKVYGGVWSKSLAAHFNSKLNLVVARVKDHCLP